ncbi:MAG: hypothetical protein QXE70_11115 [Ignisphaera sp.]
MSVTPAEKRIERFKQKLDPDIIANIIDQYKDVMIQKQTARFAEIANYQSYVKQLLAKYGIVAELTIAFMKVGGKLYNLVRKHELSVAQNEAIHYLNMTYCKYVTVFKSQETIAKILSEISAFFGIEWTAPKACYD